VLLPCDLRTLLGLSMKRMFPAEPAVLLLLHSIRLRTLVLRGRVVSSLAFSTSQSNDGSHVSLTGYFSILPTTPAPTVLPPSRMANRSPSSIAMGVMSSTFILMLSPGMTISTPSGRVIIPVTSVVRK